MKIKLTLLALLYFLSSQILAAQIAIVSVPKAVIFSDQTLSTPIGYVSYGKKIKVGEVEKKDGTILPVIVAGRVAYVQIKDLALQNGPDQLGISTPKITEHDVELTFQTDQDKLSENNFFSASIGQAGAGAGWEEYSGEFGEESSTFSVISLQMEHRNPLKDTSWGFGLTYFSASADDLEAKSLAIEANLYYSLFNFRYMSISAFGGLLFSGDFQVIQGGGEQKTNGVLYGYSIGGVARILPYSKLGAFGGISLRKIKVTELEEIETPGGLEVGIDGLSGVNIFAGISYKF
ncbi:hypothetical protein [Halobacteriovorax sp. JY17]|uniref:hypothetical protein n=1 Tax=Halobacteriovorax sp. JY17 TaxID=2014617 RepID=UPI000C3A48AE|nr:hypothetical protein [Halobacteriovorax sp. JY17]PIK15888.1 MAG: hypothetical protein CES88_03950 [Halobacteriovorax sp. JY17]